MSTKPTPTAQVITFFVLIGLMWFGCNRCNACLESSQADFDKLKTENPAEWRAKKIDRLIDPDGSIDETEYFAAAMLKDPSSFKHISTKVTDNGEDLVVSMRFTGTNSFGGPAQHSVLLLMDIEGNVKEVIETE
jgi:hypothetical protein